MITDKDILKFFDAEAEAEQSRYEALMKNNLDERIRKRKAIKGLKLIEDYKEMSPEHEYLMKFRYTQNISDFKEGDYLILHDIESKNGLKCVLYEYPEEDTLTISIKQYNMFGTYEQWAKKDLVLDKDLVDLREPVFYKFYYELPVLSSYWQEHIINTIPIPTFENIKACETKLDDTIKNFKLQFTSSQREAIINSMATNDYYMIQGPPGTGKSFVLSIIILEELLYFNRKVAVIGPNHLAINNALLQVAKVAPDLTHLTVKIGQLYQAKNLEVTQNESTYEIIKCARINVDHVNNMEGPMLYGLTPYALYTSRAKNLYFDTLIIDEAGQMTIPIALMAMQLAKKVILAGDHKQLPPIIISDKIPKELTTSIFQRMLRKESYTMLDKTFRMRGPICQFVSELFYEGQLQAIDPQIGNLVINPNPLLSFDSPIIIADVDDNGEQVSEKEADQIIKIIEQYTHTNLSSNQLAVLSPFRAQAAYIRRLLKKSTTISDEYKKDLVIDTIDKMQGQEREVIILTLVSGNPDYMNEMGEFLYNPHKLNVAFSRAKSKLIIVGNVKQLKNLDPITYPHINAMLHSKLVKHLTLQP